VSDSAPVRISLIVAMARNGVIGRDGGLPWRLSSDLKLFRRLTMGKPLIMGRRTFASLKQPLDGRDNIVVTRDPNFAADGTIIAHSFDDALARARSCARQRGADELLVIGGAEIFREALPLAHRIYLTEVEADIPGDVTFPPINWSEWTTLSANPPEKGQKDAYPFTFSIKERITPAPETV
jgi:dihydrofolate reductase